MALNLKNPRTLRAIDELAGLTGESKSEAVASAIEAKLASLLSSSSASSAADGTSEDRLREVIADSSQRFARAGLGPDNLGRLSDPTADMYDASGLPR